MLAQWDDLASTKALPDRRDRLAPLRRGDRRSVRAPARSRLLRDLRLDREHHVELAAAARHRREPVRRPARADALQRLPRGALARRPVVLLRESTAVARRPRTPCLEPGRLLPAEHHAPARLSAPLPRHDQRRRRPAPSVCDLDDPCRRAGRGPRRAGGRDGLPVVGLRRRWKWSRAATRSGRSRSGCRGGRAARSSTASRSRRDTRSSRGAGARATASSWSSTSRPGSRRRIRGSMPFAAVWPSSAGRSSTASRPTTSPAGVDLADVALQRDAEPADSGPLATLGGVPGVSVAGASATSSGGSRSSTSTFASSRGTARPHRRDCSRSPTSRGRTAEAAGCASGSPAPTSGKEAPWRPSRSSRSRRSIRPVSEAVSRVRPLRRRG